MADICIQFFRTLECIFNLFQYIFSLDNVYNDLEANCSNITVEVSFKTWGGLLERGLKRERVCVSPVIKSVCL